MVRRVRVVCNLVLDFISMNVFVFSFFLFTFVPRSCFFSYLCSCICCTSEKNYIVYMQWTAWPFHYRIDHLCQTGQGKVFTAKMI